MEEFMKQIQFRMPTAQFEYISQTFFEYILYAFEFVLLWGYHNKGANDKVFILYSKQEKIYKKAREFNFLENEEIKNEKILNLSKINKYGFLKLVFELYFLAEVLKIITDVKKIDAESFNSRLAKILAKDQKKDQIDTSKKYFDEVLSKMVAIYKEKPELLQNYLINKKKS